MENTIYVSASDFLEERLGDTQSPSTMGTITSFLALTRRQPLFTLSYIPEMVTDPRIELGLGLLKGPILSNAKFHVASDDPAIKQFVVRQIERFWLNGASQALRALEWGYTGHEIIYTGDSGLIEYDHLKDAHPLNVKVVTQDGRYCGLLVKDGMNDSNSTYLGGPKALHHIHRRDRHPWYGFSRVYPAFRPWVEKWLNGGFKEIRRMWFYRCAFDGGSMTYPMGITYPLPTGGTISSRDLALDMMEKKRTGGVMALPWTPDGRWNYIPPQANSVPAEVLEYGKDLDDEILEGMGVPPEVVTSGGGEGFGSSGGRKIPLIGMFCTLHELAQYLMYDFNRCCLRPLTQFNFGIEQAKYEIRTFGIMDSLDPASRDNPYNTGEKSESYKGKEDFIQMSLEKRRAPIRSGEVVFMPAL